MFVPKEYRPSDPRWARETVRRHPLAMLVTNGEHGPLATHLPVIPAGALDDGTGETGLVGVELLGHMNRMNPHWTTLRDGMSALLVFQGPNGYVTPTVYRTTPAAPTWNFTAVHLRGSLNPIATREETLRVVMATVEAYERDHGSGWDMTGSIAYFERIVPGVGAFRFQVTSADAMFKLSQDKPEPIREAVAEAFSASWSPSGQAIGQIMHQYAAGVPSNFAAQTEGNRP